MSEPRPIEVERTLVESDEAGLAVWEVLNTETGQVVGHDYQILETQ